MPGYANGPICSLYAEMGAYNTKNQDVSVKYDGHSPSHVIVYP